ncbi:MAG: hypothetical protein HW405_220 [Candidatus Berkelbacteria bacterium]|nr:hypothetical protein [Candidatus Berkelbacteria bacterium]
MKKLRVLHCPLNNANNAWILSRAERKIGLQSDLVVFSKGRFFSDYDQLITIDSVSIPNEIKRIKFLFEAIKKYDIFHFNFGQSIWDHPFPSLNHLDLPILKKAGKKVIFTYQGDDARQKDIFREKYGRSAYGDGKYSIFDAFLDYNKRLRIKKITKYADAIFAHNPDIMHVLPPKTRFLPYPNVDIDKIKPAKNRPSKTVKIIHAPTDRAVKGTEVVVSIIKKLATKYPLELILVENMSHEAAAMIYKRADIAIDQLKIGWYGGFAVEMMARGVPVISYLRASDMEKFVPFWREIPIVNADRNSLEEALMVLIKNSSLRDKIGKKSRQFVEKYHDPLKIARKTKKTYEDLCAA